MSAASDPERQRLLRNCADLLDGSLSVYQFCLAWSPAALLEAGPLDELEGELDGAVDEWAPPGPARAAADAEIREICARILAHRSG